MSDRGLWTVGFDLSVSVSDTRDTCCCIGRRNAIAVLENLSGVLHPGTLTLVVGPNGSGE